MCKPSLNKELIGKITKVYKECCQKGSYAHALNKTKLFTAYYASIRVC